MKKLLLLTFLVATMCLYGPAAWSIQDYPFSFSDSVGENASTQCPFTNGFDISMVTGIASEDNDAINFTVTVDGIVGNGNADAGATILPPAGWCVDNDPQQDCGEPPAGPDPCQYDDAPGNGGPTQEAYTIEICQPGTAVIGCANGGLAEIIFQPANTSGNNVFSNTPGVTVTPTNIDMNNSANWTRQFTITMHGLSGAGLDFRSQWGIKVKAGSEIDGPGEDEAGTIVSPPSPPALSCQKSFNASQAEPGQEITATVTATNNGESDTLIEIVDTLDVGFTYVAGSASAGEPTITGQTLKWTGLNLPANGSVIITYRLTVGDIAEGQTICNNVFVNSIDFPGVSAGPCLACVTRPVVQQTPVPGMTDFTMALTGLLMILATVYFIRRRHTHNS